MGIIRNGADGIQRHSLVSAGGLPKHAQGLLDSRFRTLRFDHVASFIVNANHRIMSTAEIAGPLARETA